MSVSGANRLATSVANLTLKHRLAHVSQVRSSVSTALLQSPASMIRSLPASTYNLAKRNYHTEKYVPIYALERSHHHRLLNDSALSSQQSKIVRFANTSSGFYAPSTLNSRQNVHNHESSGILTVFEDSDHLPPLPVPSLHDTLEKLRETISPIAMNPIEYASTLELINKFSKTAGPKLDLLLRNKALQTKNWMTHDWWLNEVYLKSREPLIINSNPSMIYPTFPFEVNNRRSVINTAAHLISAALDFKLSLMHGYNPETTGPDNELRLDSNICYDQYKHFFGCTRIPGEQIDSLKVKNQPINDKEPLSIVISCKGRFYEVQLNEIEDEKVRLDVLTSILDKIVSLSEEKESEELLETVPDLNTGVLTTMRRDDWAKLYPLLDRDSMESLDESQFVVCLDTIDSGSEIGANQQNNHSVALVESQLGSEEQLAALGRQILHADKLNIGNRWFDKTMQLVIVTDKHAERLLGAGVNYEHSLAEGIVVTKLIEYSFEKAVQNIRNAMIDKSNNNFFARQEVRQQEPASFRQLKMFDTSSCDATSINLVAEGLRQARRDYASQVDQFDMSYLNYKQYGSNAIKSWRFSPDSWFQVALQMAFHRAHNRLAPCYESASTRRFAYGRTETIRSLTKDVAEFCLDPDFDRLQAAIQSHKNYAVAASNASAVDRVLMGYRMIFNELRNNSWIWGVPKCDEFKNLNVDSKSNNNDNYRPNLGEVFSEDEIRIISSFFNSELIERSRRYQLSTSQVSSIHPNICMSYGPLIADGYGCCYNITGQQIVASISANSSNQSFSCEVDKLEESLRKSLDTMKDIVESEQQRTKNS